MLITLVNFLVVPRGTKTLSSSVNKKTNDNDFAHTVLHSVLHALHTFQSVSYNPI